MSSSPITRDNVHVAQKHAKYYFEGSDLHVVVQRTLFRVHSYFFTRESKVFHKKMYPAAPGVPREGLSELSPILLEDVSPEDFETFLWVFYNPQYSVYNVPVEKWTVILKLADQWGFPQIKELAV